MRQERLGHGRQIRRLDSIDLVSLIILIVELGMADMVPERIVWQLLSEEIVGLC